MVGRGLAGPPGRGVQRRAQPDSAKLLRWHQRGPARGAVYQGQGLHAPSGLGSCNPGAPYNLLELFPFFLLSCCMPDPLRNLLARTLRQPGGACVWRM